MATLFDVIGGMLSVTRINRCRLTPEASNVGNVASKSCRSEPSRNMVQ